MHARMLRALMCVFAVLTATPSFALDSTRNIRDFQHTSWSVVDGAPADVWALAQTADGFLWLGTSTGLYRFDGVRFERFHSVGGPDPDVQNISSLLAPPSGALLIGYLDGSIAILRNGRVTNFPMIGNATLTQLSQLMSGPSGEVLVESGSSISQFVNGKLTPLGISWSRDSPGTGGSFVTHGGEIWTPTPAGLTHLDLRSGKKSLIAMPLQRSQTSGPVVTEDPKGQLWLSPGAASLALIRSPDGKPVVDSGSTKASAASGSARVIFDRDGAAWGADYGLGIYRLAGDALRAGGPFDHYVEKDGLSSDMAAAILEDREGNIWVGTNRGLDRFRPTKVFTNAVIPVSSGTGYRALTANGAVYASAAGSLYRIDSTTHIDPSVSNIRPQCAYAGVSHSLGLCTRGELIEVGPNWVTHIRPPDGSPWSGKPILSAAHDNDGTLWISFFDAGIARVRDGNWSAWKPSKQRTSWLIQPDVHTGVWMRLNDGTFWYVSGEHARAFGNVDPLLGEVGVIEPLPKEVLLGTYNGLARVRDGRIDFLSAQRYPIFASVDGIAETSDGKMWIHSSAGIVRLNVRAVEAAFSTRPASLSYELLDYRDGASGPAEQNCFTNTIVKGPTGRLYFETNHGIDEVDPLNLIHNALPPPVAVTGIKARGDIRHDISGTTLAEGTSDIEIDYTGLSLSIPERVQFRYRLLGENNAWVDAGNRRQAFFTNLGPGDYRFQVAASNNDGVWNNTGATLAMTIPPTFLQSDVFRVLCGIAVLSILFAIYSLRVRQLAGQMRARNEVRMLERERIARELHDTLLQGFQALALRIQNAIERLPPDQPVRQIMEQELDRADAVLVEGRNRVKNLRAAYSIGDIPRLLRETAASFGSSTIFEIRTTGEPCALDAVVGDEVARIGVEAVNNAMRHARAKKVEAQFLFSRDHFILRIADDGAGMPPEILSGSDREGHFGLIGIRERAARIGGKISIESAPGSGSTVELSVPAAMAYGDPKYRGFLNFFSSKQDPR